MAMSIVVNQLFIEFINIILPGISSRLPKTGKTIRDMIIFAFKERKKGLKARLYRSYSKITFSFDL
jgi:hypothetical protein